VDRQQAGHRRDDQDGPQQADRSTPRAGRRILTPALYLAIGLAAAGCKPRIPAPANPEQPVPEQAPGFLVAEDAALFIGHPDVVFIDARPGREYRRGHVPGAVHLDWTELRDPAEGRLTGKLDADFEVLGALLGERGLSPDKWAIVMGDPLQHWGEEGRIAWTLVHLGASQVSVVDGGWTAWKAAGLPSQRGKLELPATTWPVTPREEVLARKGDVSRFSGKAHDDWRYVLVDVRSSDEYRGAPDAPTYGAARGGHVPGAINMPWTVLLDENGLLRPADQLERTLIPVGVRPDAHIITYCTGGVRSAHTWWVLYSLGYPDVRNYAGSWWEWSYDRKLPHEIGGMRRRPWTPEWPPPEREPAQADDDDSGADDDDSGADDDDSGAGEDPPEEPR